MKIQLLQKLQQFKLRGKREIEYLNLDMILSIWYRVDSKEATSFRKWATSILKKYLTDGYAINESKIPKLKTRVTWDFNPVTRTKPSKKLYNRSKAKMIDYE